MHNARSLPTLRAHWSKPSHPAKLRMRQKRFTERSAVMVVHVSTFVHQHGRLLHTRRMHAAPCARARCSTHTLSHARTHMLRTSHRGSLAPC